MMLLIGSRAMAKQNLLPTWRQGKTTDYDLVCSTAEFETIRAELYAVHPTNTFERNPQRDDRKLIHCKPEGGWIEFDVSNTPSRQTLLSMPDNVNGFFRGHAIKMISLPTELTLLRALQGLNCWREKHVNDVAFYEQKMTDLGLSFLPEHDIVYDQTRAEALEKFGLRDDL